MKEAKIDLTLPHPLCHNKMDVLITHLYFFMFASPQDGSFYLRIATDMAWSANIYVLDFTLDFKSIYFKLGQTGSTMFFIRLNFVR